MPVRTHKFLDHEINKQAQQPRWEESTPVLSFRLLVVFFLSSVDMSKSFYCFTILETRFFITFGGLGSYK
jgi:hypothetical protein